MFWCFPFSLERPLVWYAMRNLCEPGNWNYMSSTHFKTLSRQCETNSAADQLQCCFPALCAFLIFPLSTCFSLFSCQSPKPQGSSKPNLDITASHICRASWNARSSTCCRVSHCRLLFSAVKILREYTSTEMTISMHIDAWPKDPKHPWIELTPRSQIQCLRRFWKSVFDRLISCEFHSKISKSKLAWNVDVQGTTKNRAFGEFVKSLFLRSKALARSTGAAQKRVALRCSKDFVQEHCVVRKHFFL